MKNEKVYVATTEGDCEGKSPRRIIGYAKGCIEDIKTFYSDSAMYEVYVNEITTLTIDKETLAERLKLKQEKKDLEGRLNEIKRRGV